MNGRFLIRHMYLITFLLQDRIPLGNKAVHILKIRVLPKAGCFGGLNHTF